MAQANAALITSRPAPVIYIPEIHSRSEGYRFPEMGRAETVRDMVVSDIASGQYEHVSRVIAVDVAAGKSWDASKEIAREVLNQVLDHRGRVPQECEDFLEKHLGIEAVRSAEFEAAA